MICCVQDAANKENQLKNLLDPKPIKDGQHTKIPKKRRADSPCVEVVKLFKMIDPTEVQSKPAIITQYII